MNIVMLSLGVVAAAGANMVLGMLWYAPILFGNEWMKLSGVTYDSAQMMRFMLGCTIAAFMMAGVMAYFMDRLQINTIAGGALFGLQAWIGFVASIMLYPVFYENRPWKLFIINGGYILVSMVAMGIILSKFI